MKHIHELYNTSTKIEIVTVLELKRKFKDVRDRNMHLCEADFPLVVAGRNDFTIRYLHFLTDTDWYFLVGSRLQRITLAVKRGRREGKKENRTKNSS
jgi:hypothetical protein